MIQSIAIQEALKNGFDRVDDLGDSVVRGERLYNNRPYAVAYIDLADKVVSRAENLQEFQERLVGPDFFTSDNDIRWNSYLYFVAGPQSAQDPKFESAKKKIEGDRNFTRKYVLAEADLRARLQELKLSGLASVEKLDPAAQWSKALGEGKLAVVLEQRPRTKMIGAIGSGEAFETVADISPPPMVAGSDFLQRGRLRSLSVGTFRQVNSGRTFEFGDVNLIFGVNGSGKTSLLEAIEALYCGRIRRDPEAHPSGLVAAIELSDGRRVEIEGTRDVPTIKARNLLWYGRPDLQSSSISQGFSRFNFLDTDAAFRLSSQTDPDEIREDLGRLIVGPETAKLWNYLSKLQEDVADKLKGFHERLPALKSQVDLTAAEVKRLQDMPTEYKSILLSYGAVLKELKVTWFKDLSEDAPRTTDRANLEILERGLSNALLTIPVVPLTPKAIQERAAACRAAIEAMKPLVGEHAKASQLLMSTEASIRQRSNSLGHLRKWHQMNLAGLPGAVAQLEQHEGALRKTWKPVDMAAYSDIVLPDEYLELPIEKAVVVAAARMKLDKERVETSTQGLAAQQRLGESLMNLKRDLHDVSREIVAKTGDHTTCPVCGVVHPPDHLSRQIDRLVQDQQVTNTSSARVLLQKAKEALEASTASHRALLALQQYADAAGLPFSSTSTQLKSALAQGLVDLQERTAAVQRAKNALSVIEKSIGISRADMESMGEIVRRLVGGSGDIFDIPAIEHVIDDLKRQQNEEQSSCELARKNLMGLLDLMVGHLAGLNLPVVPNPVPETLLAAVERSARQVEETLVFLNYLGEQLSISDSQSLEGLRDSVSHALDLLDRANYALKAQEQAQSELKTKTKELDQLRLSLQQETETANNLARAQTVLAPLVATHSLERSTRETLQQIKDKVSAIFSRIHVPLEYELGDFSNEKFLVNRETKQPHKANQVSTGQRAAFALSIFLALNAIAESAPPVLLVDDPVAHVDDLNALSFLDYLRDVALGQNKQIFFATADVKLAALFQRKFLFLGHDRFVTIELGRDNTDLRPAQG